MKLIFSTFSPNQRYFLHIFIFIHHQWGLKQGIMKIIFLLIHSVLHGTLDSLKVEMSRFLRGCLKDTYNQNYLITEGENIVYVFGLHQVWCLEPQRILDLVMIQLFFSPFHLTVFESYKKAQSKNVDKILIILFLSYDPYHFLTLTCSQ